MIAIFAKELREHALILVACGCFTLLVLFALAVNPDFNGQNASAFFGFRSFLLFFYPLYVIVLTSRIVAREYTGKTQLFLETLPVSRARVLTGKFLLGLALALVVVALAFHTFGRLASRHEVIDRHGMGIIALRAFAYAGCIYAFLFAGGLLGRYRIACLLLLIVGFSLVDGTSTFRFEEFGPIRLVGHDLAYERTRLPTTALWITAGLTVGFVALGYVLALMREGTVSALLAQKMSQREKVTIACILMGMIFLKTFYDEARGPRPFDLAHAVSIDRSKIAVKIGLGQSVEPARAEALGGRIVAGLTELQSELALEELPEIFVLPARELDADTYNSGTLKNARGLVVQANFAADDFDDGDFVSWLARELVETATRGRATEERRRWLLDGFSTDWSLRESDDDARRRETLRAVYGFPEGPTEELLHDWASTRERHGECLSNALAYTGIRVLREMVDPAALRRFLHEAIARRPSRGVRALAIHEAPASEMLRTTGVSMTAFLAAWRSRLAEDSRALQGSVAVVPRLSATVDLVPASATGREVHYRVALHPEPPAPVRIAFLTSKLDPFDRELESKELVIDERTYPALRDGVLPRTLSRGERFGWEATAPIEALDCRVTTGFQRVDVR